MNPRFFVSVSMLVICLNLVPLHAAASKPVPIPDKIKISTLVPDANILADFLDPLFAELGKGNVAVRDQIVKGVRPSGALASAVFGRAYTQAVSTRVKALLDDSKTPMLAKINTGILVERLAEDPTNASSIDLDPAVRRLLSDRSDAVALWGMKAASLILSDMLNSGSKDFTAAMLASVKSHPRSGGLAGEMFDGLRKILTETQVGNAAIDSLVGPVFDLFTIRIGLYAGGVVDEPNAEKIGIQILPHPKVWSKLTAKQKHDTAQVICDLSAVLAVRVGADSGADYIKIIPTINKVGSAIGSLVEECGNDANMKALSLALQGVNRNTPQATALQSLTSVYATLSAPANQFLGGPLTAFTGPTTEPTTSSTNK